MVNKSHLGLLSIFWGNGKGKSTSAFGTALRACGNGYRVHLIQFMKNGTGNIEIDYPGEIKSLEKFSNFTFKRFGAGSWIIGNPTQEHIDSVNEAFTHLKMCMNNPLYDIIIADELLYAIQLKLISEEEVIEFLKNRARDKDLIVTGSHISFPRIFEIADLVTEIKKIKHPFDKGILARKGLEY